MKFFRTLSLLLIILLAAMCQPTPAAPAENSIAFTPDSLIFEQPGGELRFYVTASNPGIELYSEDDWVVSIEPPYSALTEGNFTVKVKPNSTVRERTGKVVIKVGQTRKYLPIRQPGLDPAVVDIDTPEGYTLVWNDEFDYEGLPASAEWKYQTGDSGWGNHELQDYVAGSYNGVNIADVSDGTLKVWAKKIDGKVRSVRLNTRKSWTYGYIEASIKLPVGKGTWPAFWMMPSNFTGWPKDGEIDIMEEVGYRPNYCSATIHCNRYNNGGTSTEHAEKYIATGQTEFHIYGMEWTADYITFYQDRKAILTYRNTGGGHDVWPFYKAFYIILNLAWGGDWGGAQGVDESCLPTAMEVDWVRVFQKL